MKNLLLITILFFLTAGLVFGQDNYSKISQSDNGHSAEITQTGASNRVGDPSNPNEGGVVQSGSNNAVTITQSGGSNTVSQFRLEKGVTNALVQNGEGNSAIIQQMDGGQIVGLRTYAYHPGLEQQGNSNHAEIYQSGGSGNHVGELYQHGTSNEAYIDQSGDGNYANLHQRGNGESNQSGIMQHGTNNDAGDIAINGSNNLTGVVQGFGGVLPSKGSDVTMSCNDGGEMLLPSDNNYAKQWINGTYNNAAILQGGDGGNHASQHLPSTYYGTGNYVIITQYGSGNDATQYIGGNGNVSNVSQLGVSNNATVNSVGDNNQSDIYQTNY